MTALAGYREAHDFAIADPEGYWAQQLQLVDWIKAPTVILDAANPPFYRWFPDGTLNTCFNAVDRHVLAGHGERAAIVYDSPVTGQTATITYAP
jgi:propionyl-CoA synthetase